jgi:hypothetical protein
MIRKTLKMAKGKKEEGMEKAMEIRREEEMGRRATEKAKKEGKRIWQPGRSQMRLGKRGT